MESHSQARFAPVCKHFLRAENGGPRGAGRPCLLTLVARLCDLAQHGHRDLLAGPILGLVRAPAGLPHGQLGHPRPNQGWISTATDEPSID